MLLPVPSVIARIPLHRKTVPGRLQFSNRALHVRVQALMVVTDACVGYLVTVSIPSVIARIPPRRRSIAVRR